MLNTSSSSFRPVLQPALTPATPSSASSVQADATAQRTAAPAPAVAPQTSNTDVLRTMALVSAPQPLTNAQAIAILKKPPFKPTNPNLVSPGLYSGKAMPPAKATKAVTSADMKTQLTSIFKTRFKGNSAKMQAGLAVFNDPKLKKIIPDVRLRASLTSLYGTASQSSIDTIKSGVYSSATFKPWDRGTIAMTMVNTSGPDRKPRIEINSRYQNEDIRTLASMFAHEPLHQDLNRSVAEERIAHSLDTMVYAQFVSEDPSLASKPTELTQRTNSKLMARLNSRDANGNLRIFSSQGNVYPGSKAPLDNFGAAFIDDHLPDPFITFGPTSPGNAHLAALLKGVTGVSVAHPNFDAKTDAIIDQHQTLFTPVQLVKIMKALSLKVS
jgi:hypothetical protein